MDTTEKAQRIPLVAEEEKVKAVTPKKKKTWDHDPHIHLPAYPDVKQLAAEEVKTQMPSLKLDVTWTDEQLIQALTQFFDELIQFEITHIFHSSTSYGQASHNAKEGTPSIQFIQEALVTLKDEYVKALKDKKFTKPLFEHINKARAEEVERKKKGINAELQEEIERWKKILKQSENDLQVWKNFMSDSSAPPSAATTAHKDWPLDAPVSEEEIKAATTSSTSSTSASSSTSLHSLLQGVLRSVLVSSDKSLHTLSQFSHFVDKVKADCAEISSKISAEEKKIYGADVDTKDLIMQMIGAAEQPQE